MTNKDSDSRCVAGELTGPLICCLYITVTGLYFRSWECVKDSVPAYTASQLSSPRMRADRQRNGAARATIAWRSSTQSLVQFSRLVTFAVHLAGRGSSVSRSAVVPLSPVALRMASPVTHKEALRVRVHPKLLRGHKVCLGPTKHNKRTCMCICAYLHIHKCQNACACTHTHINAQRNCQTLSVEEAPQFCLFCQAYTQLCPLHSSTGSPSRPWL